MSAIDDAALALSRASKAAAHLGALTGGDAPEFAALVDLFSEASAAWDAANDAIRAGSDDADALKLRALDLSARHKAATIACQQKHSTAH